jgi:putative transposase
VRAWTTSGLIFFGRDQDRHGTNIKNTTHAKYFSKQIEKLQSLRDSNTTKGSGRFKKLSRTINKLHDAKNRKIDDFQHKVSKRLARKYDTIYAEDLSVKNMLAGGWTTLNKNVQNAKFGQFLIFLGYKVNHLVLVNPKNTSKTCNNCGKIHTNLKLSDRIITCDCGSIYDRDVNASKNIYCLGQAILEHPEYVGLTIQEALAFRRG